MTRADLKPRKPGRPEGQNNLSEEILDAAEVMFAEQGFAGTTLRQVADKLGVNPAMIAYYFQNKDNLFRSVFTRRGHAISAARMERLAALSGRSYDVEDLVKAFIEPAAALYGNVQGRAFLKLHARLHMEPEDLSFELRRAVHNESTHAYAGAFGRLLALPDREIYQRMSLLIGAYLYAFSGTSRLTELMGNDDDPMREMLQTTIAFGTAGMLAGGGLRERK
ncbi:TetR/AcrR family transcriptional regulator [Falsirhodobacter xinxiangensis]|uniref:TetR/AcrR family transcriptional regulator n=1 Tax=Falsirhodobacter xinxiangensis TaxID=2530049 RepID=UPI0010AAEFFD|nr:TetR/AcrR family transcriptional regulator [Rhodobacter xinxiangensis]